MAIGWWIWVTLLGLISLVWLSRHREITVGKRLNLPLTPDSYDGPPASAPMVSFLIAAKDEEKVIERAVRTVLEQDYPNFELIVINDRSTDRTREILDRLAKEVNDPGRFRVIHIEKLRDGWFGKNNAMREGVSHARGDWFCFSDADCQQLSKRTLSMSMRHAIEQKVDFLSVLPILETHSFWERVVQPACGAVMIFWFNPKRVNNPDHREAYANGAFMLMNRTTYDAVGGHDAVRTEVNEDMHMARLAKEKRRRLLVVQNDGLYSCHMYSGLRQIWRGWSRIFYGCFGTFRRLMITMVVMTLMNLFPYGSAGLAWLMTAVYGWSHAGAWAAVAVAASCAVVAQLSAIARFYRISRASPWLAPTFVLGIAICVGMLISAMRRLGGRTQTVWRGTTYQGNRVASP